MEGLIFGCCRQFCNDDETTNNNRDTFDEFTIV